MVEDRPEMDYLQNEIIDYVINRTAITKDQIQEWLEKKQDTYFHSKEAIKLGIIDKENEDWQILFAITKIDEWYIYNWIEKARQIFSLWKNSWIKNCKSNNLERGI